MNKRIRKKQQKLAYARTQNLSHIVSEIELQRIQAQIAEYEALPEETKVFMKRMATTGRKNGAALITFNAKDNNI